MIELRDKHAFGGFWARWKMHLEGLVKGKGGKLYCPDRADILFEETDFGYRVKPNLPICLYTIPQKGTSRTDKLMVFIDGAFEFKKQAKGEIAELISAHSNVAFFKAVEGANKLTFQLLDAYHFDHFTEDPKTSAPHPVFHAQRNIRPDVTFAPYRETLEKFRCGAEIEDISQEVKNALFGLKTFRLPTPQVDLFSLSAILAADHLTDQCKHDSESYKKFKSFLEYIEDDVIKVVHQPDICAKVAKDPKRHFIPQWYARH